MCVIFSPEKINRDFSGIISNESETGADPGFFFRRGCTTKEWRKPHRFFLAEYQLY